MQLIHSLTLSSLIIVYLLKQVHAEVVTVTVTKFATVTNVNPEKDNRYKTKGLESSSLYSPSVDNNKEPLANKGSGINSIYPTSALSNKDAKASYSDDQPRATSGAKNSDPLNATTQGSLASSGAPGTMSSLSGTAKNTPTPTNASQASSSSISSTKIPSASMNPNITTTASRSPSLKIPTATLQPNSAQINGNLRGVALASLLLALKTLLL
ncbi:hypothetical protein K7432_011564 [Basidiobolus ranarum]|uniref:Uncharacterized protein n=1 Tax=Basidiobolus ranarum TaxID=34480 RepID=A0ABR2VTP1_9FUNG